MWATRRTSKRKERERAWGRALFLGANKAEAGPARGPEGRGARGAGPGRPQGDRAGPAGAENSGGPRCSRVSGGIVFRLFFFSKGDKVSAAASVGDGRSPLATIAPLYPPARGRVPLQPLYEAGLRSRLPPRSVLDGAHRAPGPPSHPPHPLSRLTATAPPRGSNPSPTFPYILGQGLALAGERAIMEENFVGERRQGYERTGAGAAAAV